MQPAAYHHTDPAYAPPLVNPPSPAASVTSIYGEDETTMSDAGLPEDKFEEKMQLAIGISQPSEWETHANRLVLLPKPKNPDDERVLYEHVMINLRRQVRALQENELFERALLQPTQVAQSPLPSTNDIDALMRSMMGYPAANTQPPSSAFDFGTPHTHPLGWGPNAAVHGTAPHMPVGGTFWDSAADVFPPARPSTTVASTSSVAFPPANGSVAGHARARSRRDPQ